MYKKYSQITNSSNNLIFLYMSLFDSEQNITYTQLNLIIGLLPQEANFGGACPGGSWFLETHASDDSVIYLNIKTVKESYTSAWDAWELFEEQFNTLQVDLNSQESVAQQLGNIIKDYIKDPDCTSQVDDLFVSFNCNVYTSLASIYNAYILRNMVGQRGFECPPEYIGYLHIRFYFKSRPDSIIHWYLPMRLIKDK